MTRDELAAKYGAASGLSGDAGPEGKMPARSASKADWVAYATGAGLDRAEADAMTRDQLVERFTTKGAS
ncbi:hypothetical protein [Kitasatospora fiedleri]|uniref:hypothetical protein n=1 Tax=Kitasatospora fiedleri TaxID=2991545 RepID=UPI00249A0379|nr:hypothetical protein [Kitasatospora fiedleri]